MTIISEKEEVKRAIRWVSDQLEVNPGQSVQKLVNRAALEFDLSPVNAEFLSRFFRS